MAVTQLSQKDYLKKYLSSNTDDKKKRKKKKLQKATQLRFRVVDDDIDLKNMRPLDEEELDLYQLAEDAPQIAGIVDERPDDMRMLEEFRGSQRWKLIQHDGRESPRRKDGHRSSPDTPPRKSRGHVHSGNSCSDNSPQRMSKRPRNASSPSFNSPKKNDSEGRGKGENKNVHQDKRNKIRGKMEKTLDGKRAGLQIAGEVRQEISDFKRREDELFAQMSDEISGRGAAVVKRDRKTGKRRDLEEEAKQKQEDNEKMAQQKEKYSRWGKGLKQVEEQKENLQQALHEMSKPLARYADDKDLEEHLRNQEREGDPMLEYIRSKKTEETAKSKPKYQGSFLPNRFGIAPGHRWDGVDRSNGYEKQWFEQQSSRRAVEEEAYKWSTSDM